MDRVRDGRDLMENDGMEKPWMPPFPSTPEQNAIFAEMLALFAAFASDHPNYRYQQRTGEEGA